MIVALCPREPHSTSIWSANPSVSAGTGDLLSLRPAGLGSLGGDYLIAEGERDEADGGLAPTRGHTPTLDTEHSHLDRCDCGWRLKVGLSDARIHAHCKKNCVPSGGRDEPYCL